MRYRPCSNWYTVAKVTKGNIIGDFQVFSDLAPHCKTQFLEMSFYTYSMQTQKVSELTLNGYTNEYTTYSWNTIEEPLCQCHMCRLTSSRSVSLTILLIWKGRCCTFTFSAMDIARARRSFSLLIDINTCASVEKRVR